MVKYELITLRMIYNNYNSNYYYNYYIIYKSNYNWYNNIKGGIAVKKEQLTKFNRGQSSKIFRKVIESGEPLVVMQRDNAMVVILSAEKYVELTNAPIQIEVYTKDHKGGICN